MILMSEANDRNGQWACTKAAQGHRSLLLCRYSAAPVTCGQCNLRAMAAKASNTNRLQKFNTSNALDNDGAVLDWRACDVPRLCGLFIVRWEQCLPISLWGIVLVEKMRV